MPIQIIKEVHPLLSKFSIEAISQILHQGKLLRLKSNQILYQCEDLDLKVYIIIYGTLELI